MSNTVLVDSLNSIPNLDFIVYSVMLFLGILILISLILMQNEKYKMELTDFRETAK